MTRILVIGKSGQMAQAFAGLGIDDLYCAGRDEADLLDPQSLEKALKHHRPEIIINAGAYTAVDRAESEPDHCRALNVDGPRELAGLCDAYGVPLIHLSTDCVFDGRKPTPYLPSDVTCPMGVYGQSKLDGEEAVRSVAARSIIVRVSWIFSHLASNFVTTMLGLAGSRESISVVNDQFGCPTYAPALAEALVTISDCALRADFQDWGIYHLAGAGEIDRASMARLIFEVSARHDGPCAEVNGIPTKAYPTPAQRPLNARLDMSDTERVFSVSLPDWRLGLEETVRVLIEEFDTP